MADFQDIMKQAKRMCKQYTECIDCPLYGYIDEICETCPFAGNYEATKLESVVMDWAEKNPATRYPTWDEWQKANFPEGCNEGGILPCRFVGVEEMERIAGKECNRYSCRDCAKTEIPADVAEKLGIKPIGGGDNG